MARFMAERAPQAPGGQRYDREGLYHWAKQRFPGAADNLMEEEFRIQSRARLQERVLEVSRRFTRVNLSPDLRRCPARPPSRWHPVKWNRRLPRSPRAP